MNRRSAIRYALGGLAAGTVMMLPGLAAADTKSTQGDDYSVDQNNRTKMMTCDEEADSHKVHSDVRFATDPDNTIKWVTDGDGANGVCASKSASFGQFSQHRTVEEQVLGDSFGNWVSTT